MPSQPSVVAGRWWNGGHGLSVADRIGLCHDCWSPGHSLHTRCSRCPTPTSSGPMRRPRRSRHAIESGRLFPREKRRAQPWRVWMSAVDGTPAVLRAVTAAKPYRQLDHGLGTHMTSTPSTQSPSPTWGTISRPCSTAQGAGAGLGRRPEHHAGDLRVER